MIRLTGILAGSALAVGLLMITLGVPEPATPEPAGGVVPAAESDIALMPLPAPANPEQPPPATEDDAPGATSQGPAEAAPEITDHQLVEQIFNPQPEPPLDEHWYAFWSPFRSEIAANGFVSRLQQTTGMDYRVVKLKPGVYEVAFAYTDQDDIEQKLARISAATGLDMSGG